MAAFAQELDAVSIDPATDTDLQCRIVAASIFVRAVTPLGRAWIRRWSDFGTADGESLIVAPCYWEDICDAASADGVRIAVEPGP